MTAPPPPPFDLQATLAQDGPLSRETAMAALDHAGELMTTADFIDAARLYQRVIGFNDVAITGAALVGLGEALHRLDDDWQALATWEEATRLPDNPATYTAWRNVAAAKVRASDLQGAIVAYREAEKRAPQSDRAEIASRLGWLSKEVGDQGAAGRYFARARGEQGFSVAIGVLAVTVIVSLTTDFAGQAGQELLRLLELNKPLVAAGELWRLWTVVLVHAPLGEMPLHLLFNMYFLYLAGPFVERLYGRWTFLALYLLFAAGASLTSFAFTAPPDAPIAVGASGAIFGLFGLLVAAERIHRPVLDQQSRSFMGQLDRPRRHQPAVRVPRPRDRQPRPHRRSRHRPGHRGAVRADARADAAIALGPPGPDARDDGARVRDGRQPRDPRRGSRAHGCRVLRPVDDGRRRLGVAGVLDAPRPVAADLRERGVAGVPRDGRRPRCRAGLPARDGDR